MSTGGANPGVSSAASAATRAIFFGDYAAADEGSYYTASMLITTTSTAVATTTQILGCTSPALVVYNQNPVGGYNIYMRSVKIRLTTVNTGSTTIEQVGVLNNNIANLTTVGTLMTNGPVSTNSNSGTTSKALIYAGVNVCAAPTASVGSRICHTGPVTGIIPIVLDQWMFSYGDVGTPSSFGAIIGTTGGVVTVPLPPVIIAPQWFYTLGFWGASTSTTAPVFRIDVGYIERPAGQ